MDCLQSSRSEDIHAYIRHCRAEGGLCLYVSTKTTCYQQLMIGRITVSKHERYAVLGGGNIEMSDRQSSRHTGDFTSSQKPAETKRFPNILGHASTLNSRSVVEPSQNTTIVRERYPFGMIRVIRLGWVHFASPVRIFTSDFDIAVSVLIDTRPSDNERIAVFCLEQRWPTRLILVIADATSRSGIVCTKAYQCCPIADSIRVKRHIDFGVAISPIYPGDIHPLFRCKDRLLEAARL